MRFCLLSSSVRGLSRENEAGPGARAKRVAKVIEGRFRGMTRVAGLLTAVCLLVQGCERNPYKLTECVNGEPVVERIHDVAPPNC